MSTPRAIVNLIEFADSQRNGFRSQNRVFIFVHRTESRTEHLTAVVATPPVQTSIPEAITYLDRHPQLGVVRSDFSQRTRRTLVILQTCLPTTSRSTHVTCALVCHFHDGRNTLTCTTITQFAIATINSSTQNWSTKVHRLRQVGQTRLQSLCDRQFFSVIKTPLTFLESRECQEQVTANANKWSQSHLRFQGKAGIVEARFYVISLVLDFIEIVAITLDFSNHSLFEVLGVHCTVRTTVSKQGFVAVQVITTFNRHIAAVRNTVQRRTREQVVQILVFRVCCKVMGVGTNVRNF